MMSGVLAVIVPLFLDKGGPVFAIESQALALADNLRIRESVAVLFDVPCDSRSCVYELHA